MKISDSSEEFPLDGSWLDLIVDICASVVIFVFVIGAAIALTLTCFVAAAIVGP